MLDSRRGLFHACIPIFPHKNRVAAIARPTAHPKLDGAYFREPKISCTILSFNCCSALLSGRVCFSCPACHCSKRLSGTSIRLPSRSSIRYDVFLLLFKSYRSFLVCLLHRRFFLCRGLFGLLLPRKRRPLCQLFCLLNRLNCRLRRRLLRPCRLLRCLHRCLLLLRS